MVNEKLEIYSVCQIANYFIQEGKGKFNHTQLQKLCYISQGITLALLDKFLFYEEIQAWQYGPVISTLYSKLKPYNPDSTRSIKNKIPNYEIPNFNDYTKKILDFVFNHYGKYTAGQLTNLTHEKDTPWYKVWNKEEWSTIPPNLIQDYYKTRLENANNQQK